MPHILFVCTANVFRSLTADLALQSAAPANSGVVSSSAGTGDFDYPTRRLRSDVKEGLLAWGANPASHMPRRLTQAIVDSADLIVAMSRDHQTFIKQHYNRHAPLYMEVATGNDRDVPDLWEAVPDYRDNKPASSAYVLECIDMIFNQRAAFLQNLPRFLPGPAPIPAPRLAP